MNIIGSINPGLNVISSTEFEVILFLNQMGVFNFVDDGSLPGCAVLKLSDGRKRSMSLWVEFITASGYLSAKKIRSRFQTLVSKLDRFSRFVSFACVITTRFFCTYKTRGIRLAVEMRSMEQRKYASFKDYNINTGSDDC